MSYDLGILNGTVVTGSGTKKTNIYVIDGKIAELTDKVYSDAKETIDAEGKYVFPGFIETHVHSRDGRKGLPEKEDFNSSTSAAAATGITTVFEMPNCAPPIYNVENLEDLVSIIEPKAHTDFCVWGLALGDVNRDQIAKLAEAGVVAFKFFWGYAIDAKTYGLIYNYRTGMEGVYPPPDEGQIYNIFREVKKTGKRVGIHAENFNIIKTLTAEELQKGDTSYAALLRTRPSSAETSIIDTAIDMAKEIGVPLHILHVGVADGVEHIKRAKADGVDLTAETCSHYLALTDEMADACGAKFKTYPLVRTACDRDRVWKGIQEGSIDWVCSDHAPHLYADKQKNFWDAPAGISGVEALGPVVLTAVNDGKITAEEAVRITSENAAKTFGLWPKKGAIQAGSDADFAIVDMEKEYVFDETKMKSKAKWTPYNGMSFKGRVVRTILRGTTTMLDDEITDVHPGKFIRCK